MTQAALWVLMIVPWFVLFFLDGKRVCRFISAALFTILLTSITWQIAQVYHWWAIDENLPFLTIISAFNYGMLPIVTLLVFYFFYSRPIFFFAVNIVIDAIQAFLISPLLFVRLKFYHFENMSNAGLFLLLLSFVPIIFIYQKIYDRHYADLK